MTVILQEDRAGHRLLLLLEDGLQVRRRLVPVGVIHAPWLTKTGVLLDQSPIEPGGDRSLLDDLLLTIPSGSFVENVVNLPLTRFASCID